MANSTPGIIGNAIQDPLMKQTGNIQPPSMKLSRSAQGPSITQSSPIQDPLMKQSGDIQAPLMKQTEGAAPISPPSDEYKAPEVSPVTTEVAPEGETVESRLSNLTAEGSRYTDLAKADAIRQANTRGLINTTMAGAAGTEAAIRAALPIAQQDAKTMTDTRMANQLARNEFLRSEQAHQFNIDRDKASAGLNEGLATLESSLRQSEMTLDNELRTAFETTIQDARFSDEAKMNIVNNMNNIIRDTQEQITQVGLSDRSAAQQVAAIDMIQKTRDAELAVYQDLLSSFNDWEWGTEFTPATSTGANASAQSILPPKPTEPPAQSGGDSPLSRVISRSANQVSPDGRWMWNGVDWVPSA